MAKVGRVGDVGEQDGDLLGDVGVAMGEQVEEASDTLDLRQATQLLVIVVGVLAEWLLILFDGLQSVGLDHDSLLFFAFLLENVAEVDVLMALVLILSVEVSRSNDSAIGSARGRKQLAVRLFRGCS